MQAVQHLPCSCTPQAVHCPAAAGVHRCWQYSWPARAASLPHPSHTAAQQPHNPGSTAAVQLAAPGCPLHWAVLPAYPRHAPRCSSCEPTQQVPIPETFPTCTQVAMQQCTRVHCCTNPADENTGAAHHNGGLPDTSADQTLSMTVLCSTTLCSTALQSILHMQVSTALCVTYRAAWGLLVLTPNVQPPNV
jgi:hypothetical protein